MACLLWLNTPNLGETGIRLFVLVFGGSVGLVLFILSIGRAIFWKQDIFLGGISAWQGENAWHFWLCAYAFFASLVLMFVSFNLARADVRTNVILRRVMYGYDTIVQALLLLGILTVLNVVVYAVAPFTYDWTKTRGTYSVADSTKNLIGGLKNDVNVVVFLPQTTWGYRDVRNRMDNCRAINPHFNVEYVSPDANPYRYEELAKVFPKILPDSRMSGAGRGILIVNGPIPKEEEHKVPYSFVPERKLSEIDRAAQQTGEKGKNLFKGEIEVIKELKFLLQDRKNAKVYILQGDDEPDFSDLGGRDRGIDLRIGFKSVGIGFFVERLKNDNYEVIGLSFRSELVEQKNAWPCACPHRSDNQEKGNPQRLQDFDRGRRVQCPRQRYGRGDRTLHAGGRQDARLPRCHRQCRLLQTQGHRPGTAAQTLWRRGHRSIRAAHHREPARRSTHPDLRRPRSFRTIRFRNNLPTSISCSSVPPAF